ncbi:polyserase-2-like [Rana temporaria]|uniref:polyserase-2-like n=1 Tax=Rana temporaria TaxID=8407 RepID=UPI001AADFBFC|nr:polyserase-2-like [Rana temporaria]
MKSATYLLLMSVLSFSVLPIDTVPSSPVCGSPAVANRIVGGTDAMEGMWPWQVSLRFNGRAICGGSLISNQWVMTAAHCLQFSSSASRYTVYLGAYRIDTPSANEVAVRVIQLIVNSQFSGMGSSGDIALLGLAKPITFTPFIQPICIPPASVVFSPGTSCWVTGWGDTKYGVNLGYPRTLQQVMVPLISRESCDKMYRIDSAYTPTQTVIKFDQICAGYQSGQQDACLGDSGGPLVCQANGMWYQVGIVSWGDDCALPNRPGVYTSVSAYESWINNYKSTLPSSSSGLSASLLLLVVCLIIHGFLRQLCGSAGQSSACGSPSVSGRIVGGTAAAEGAWPWQVSLRYLGSHVCGGSLISSKSVLTAAHCLQYSKSAADYQVSLGTYILSQYNSNAVVSKVQRILINSTYQSSVSGGDIALLRLSNSITFTNFIQPICLPSASITFYPNMSCWVTGWGNVASGVVLPAPKTLQQVMTPFISRDTCDQWYHEYSGISYSKSIIASDQICAGYIDGQKDSCQGDSGGPLVCKVSGTWYQAGIVSWGSGCAASYRPGVYTYVPLYEAWIAENGVSALLPSTYSFILTVIILLN